MPRISPPNARTIVNVTANGLDMIEAAFRMPPSSGAEWDFKGPSPECTSTDQAFYSNNFISLQLYSQDL